MQDARFHSTGPVGGCPWQLVGPICFEAARSRYVTSMVQKFLNSPMPCYRTNHEPIILSNYPSFVAKNTRPLVTTFIDLYKMPMNPLDNKINACINLLLASAGRICWKRFPCKMVSKQALFPPSVREVNFCSAECFSWRGGAVSSMNLALYCSNHLRFHSCRGQDLSVFGIIRQCFRNTVQDVLCQWANKHCHIDPGLAKCKSNFGRTIYLDLRLVDKVTVDVSRVSRHKWPVVLLVPRKKNEIVPRDALLSSFLDFCSM